MNNQLKRILPLLSLLLCALMLAACGDSNPTPPLSPTMTAAQPSPTSASASFPTVTTSDAQPTNTTLAALPTATSVAIELPTVTPEPAAPTDTSAPEQATPTLDVQQPSPETGVTPPPNQTGLSASAVEQGAKSGRYFIYDVSAGDTIASVATATGMDANQLAQLNKLDVNAPLTAGRTLLVQTEVGGDLGFMPASQMAQALQSGGMPRVLLPGPNLLQSYDFRLALHRVKMATPASGATSPGYIFVFYTVKDSIIGGRGDEDVSIIDPAFVVAGGSLADQVNQSNGSDFYQTDASGIKELVKTYKGARSSAQQLYAQIAAEVAGGDAVPPPVATPTQASGASGQQTGLSTSEIEQAAKNGRYFIYDVSAGDTLADVAQAFGLDTDTLAQLNKLDPSATLSAGRTLLVQTTLAGDLSFMANGPIVAALGKNGLPRILFPGLTTLQQYNSRIALHRAKLSLPASGVSQPSYVFVFYTTKDSIMGEKGNEDLTIIAPAFAVAGGPLAKTVSASGGSDFYATTANGIDEMVKTYPAAQSSAQSLWQQLVGEQGR